jgi:lysophospholipase L1-like esterase
LFILLAACTKNYEDNTMPIYNQPAPAITKKYLALGDSYTIGQSVSTADRFPVQAYTYLTAEGINVTTPDIIAVTGWTTGNLLTAINNSTYTNNYDFVTLLIGVNNQYQGLSIDAYKVDFTTLLARAIQYAKNIKTHVFVLSIPDYSVTPFAQGHDTAKIAKEIDAFNLVNKTITDSAGITYINITPISREARTNPSLIANDGLHPSGQQYYMWVNLLGPLMKASQ